MILGVNRTSLLCLQGKSKFLKDQDRGLSPIEETLSVLESRALTIHSMRGAPAAQRDLYPKTLACGRPQNGQVAGICGHSEHSEESHQVCAGGWVAEGRGWGVSWCPVLAVTAAGQVRVG